MLCVGYSKIHAHSLVERELSFLLYTFSLLHMKKRVTLKKKKSSVIINKAHGWQEYKIIPRFLSTTKHAPNTFPVPTKAFSKY